LEEVWLAEGQEVIDGQHVDLLSMGLLVASQGVGDRWAQMGARGQLANAMNVPAITEPAR